jgi:hypothetical protein
MVTFDFKIGKDDNAGEINDSIKERLKVKALEFFHDVEYEFGPKFDAAPLSLKPTHYSNGIKVDAVFKENSAAFLKQLKDLTHAISEKSIWQNDVDGFRLAEVRIVKKCTKGRLHKKTNRCRKNCVKGTRRHKTRCRKVCEKGKRRSRKTKRCRSKKN